MRTITVVCAALACGFSGASLACEMPSLVMIPAKKEVAGKEAEVRDAAAKYFQEMKIYTQCVQAELVAAGGDSAAPLMKQVLVQRNNAAVAEAQAVMKLFTENVGPVEPKN